MASPVAAVPPSGKPKLAVTTPVTLSLAPAPGPVLAPVSAHLHMHNHNYAHAHVHAQAHAHAHAYPRSLSSAVSEPQQTPLSAVSRSSAFRDLPSASGAFASPFSYSFSRRGGDEPKTPITPPVAYIDFLRLQSPVSSGACSPTTATAKPPGRADPDPDDDEDEKDKDKTAPPSDSAPSTASSAGTDLSCKCEGHNTTTPAAVPRLATATATAPVPPSPVALAATAAAAGETPLSALSPVSPFSARSGPVRSPFDWDAAVAVRRFADAGAAGGVVTTTTTTTTTTEPNASASAGASAGASASASAGAGAGASASAGIKRDASVAVHLVREVVTRTVTYTPRVGPAPKGKRRKVDHDSDAGQGVGS